MNYKQKFSTIAELQQLNESNEYCWFSPSSMRFFNTVIKTDIIRNRYFITSEHSGDHVIKYSVRMAKNNGDIVTVGDFNSFKSLHLATKFIKDLPNQFYEAYELAHAQWMNEPIKGLNFTMQACIEPENSKDNSFSKDSFCGACTYLAINYQKLDMGFVASLINGNDLLTRMEYDNTFSS